MHPDIPPLISQLAFSSLPRWLYKLKPWVYCSPESEGQTAEVRTEGSFDSKSAFSLRFLNSKNSLCISNEKHGVLCLGENSIQTEFLDT